MTDRRRWEAEELRAYPEEVGPGIVHEPSLVSLAAREAAVSEKAEKVSVLNIWRFADAHDRVFVGVALAAYVLLGVAPTLQTVFGSKANVCAALADYSCMRTAIFRQALLSVGAFVAGVVGAFCIEYSAERQIRNLKLRYVHSLLRQEVGFFEDGQLGGNAKSLSTDLEVSCVQLRDGFGLKVGEVVKNTSLFVAGFAFALYYNWRLTLVLASVVPLLGIALSNMVKYIGIMARRAKDEYTRAGALAEESLAAIRTVAAFSLEDVFYAKFARLVDHSIRNEMKSSVVKGLGVGIMKMLLFGCNALGWWYGGKLIAHHVLRVGPDGIVLTRNILVAFFCTMKAGNNLNSVAPGLNAMAIAARSVVTIEEILSRETAIDPQDGRGHRTAADGSTKLRGEIEFRDVHFAYRTRPERPIYNGVSFKMHAGETAALVGPSGAGKSTVVQLIQRFYQAKDKSIYIDGRPIEDYNLRWLRAQMALVSQEPRLFCATIRENIKYGKENATDEEMIAAAKAANAHDFISKMPDQYDTHVGAGGSLLSGGQKQRVAIARAILVDPAILILDEATSALDNRSEKSVQKALDKLLLTKARTTIIIAHRLTTIRQAKHIIVLQNVSDGSRVAEEGDHAALMKIENGIYRQLVLAQSGEDERKKSVTEDGDDDNDTGRSQSLISSSSSSHSLVLVPAKEAEVVKRAGVRALWKLQLQLQWAQFIITTICSGLIGAVQGVNGVMVGTFMSTFMSYNSDHSTAWNSNRMYDKAVILAYVYIGIAIGFGICHVIEGWLSDRVSHYMIGKMRKLAFYNMLHQEMEFFDDPAHHTGYLCSILSGDCELAKTITGQNFTVMFQSIVCLIIGIGISFYFSAQLTAYVLLIYCVTIPTYFLQAQLMQASRSNKQKLYNNAAPRKWYGRRRKQPAQLGGEDGAESCLSEILNNIKTIAAYNLQEQLYQKYKVSVDDYFRLGVRNTYITMIAVGLSESMLMLSIAMGYRIALPLLKAGRLAYVDMVRTLMCLFFSCNGVSRQASFISDTKRATQAVHTVFGLIGRKSRINCNDPTGRDDVDLAAHDIKVSNVRFRYPTRPNNPVLEHVDFTIPKNQTVALIGESGSGKSTIIQFLERFYDPCPEDRGSHPHYRGCVRVDGVDLKDLSLRHLRGQLGIVSQEPVLFDATVEENIRFGVLGRTLVRQQQQAQTYRELSALLSYDEILAAVDEACSHEDVVAAAKLANAHEFIEALPEGYATRVGRGGALLSGGQKQRVAVARALIRNPKVLLLDEATSALDPESEKCVQAALDEVLAREKRTTIVIAHRLSTVRNADTIVVFRPQPGVGSVIAEIGNHDQLMAIPNGIYRTLVNIAAT